MIIEKFISFIGPARTGHSLIASLLSVHPEIAISLNINPLNKYRRGVSRENVFELIANYYKNDEKREIGGYSYYIKNNFQKSRAMKHIKIFGDSASSRRNAVMLAKDKVVRGFCKYIGIPIYWFWVIRNPFDNIQSACKISGRGIDYVIKSYIKRMYMANEFCEKHKENIFTVHLEKFIFDPTSSLIKILKYLDVECSDEYLSVCVDFIFTKPHKVFCAGDWNDDQINKVNDLIKSMPRLRRYSK